MKRNYRHRGYAAELKSHAKATEEAAKACATARDSHLDEAYRLDIKVKNLNRIVRLLKSEARAAKSGGKKCREQK